MEKVEKKAKSKKMTSEKKVSVENSILRLIFAAFCVISQVVWLYIEFYKIYEYSKYISAALRVLAFILTLIIYGKHTSSSMKMPWIFLIFTFPIFGTFLYILIGLSGSTKMMRERFNRIDGEIFGKLPENKEIFDELKTQSSVTANICNYIKKASSFPVYKNSDTVFYADTCDALEAIKADLKTAKNFIFMEYHAIEDTEAFHGIEEILKQKVKEGVEVRVFYDDVGSIGYLNKTFVKRMQSEGISVRIFNPVTPFINVFLNNRDHRKITVIDGKIAHTGGYNLANEYFNITHPYGKWKDSGIRVEGDAAKSFTVLFLEMWNAIKKTDLAEHEFDRYFPQIEYIAKEGNAFIQPYYDSPLDHETTGENVYMDIISGAKKYVWMTTPYLILTDEMIRCIELAAKKGVDVRIITPGIPDKKFIFKITRSYYGSLLNAGVRIFEYSPGFLHAKQFISDDKVATCGTINLDYRSLYHHFENGVLIYNSHSINDIKNDFESMFKESHEVKDKNRLRRSGSLTFGQSALRLVSPLL